MFSHITHLIYDMDGLLLDTESVYTEAAMQVCARYGKRFDWSLKSKLMGRPALESATDLVKWLSLPITPQAYLAERKIILERLLPKARPMPGAVALTRFCKKHQLPQAVATSSDREFFAIKTTRHHAWFNEVFDLIVTSDDTAVKSGKPAPDIFLAAANRLQADPKHCLVFEDSPAGVQAAIAAGMPVIAVPDPACDKTLLTQATKLLHSLEDFNTDWLFPHDRYTTHTRA